MQEALCPTSGEGCCSVEGQLTASLPSALRLMKYSLEPFSWSRTGADLKDIVRAAEALGYPPEPNWGHHNMKPAVYGATFNDGKVQKKNGKGFENSIDFLGSCTVSAKK